MNVIQKKKILRHIIELEKNIEILKEARMEAVLNGYSSASISTTGGSKSYSRFTPDQYTALIDEMMRELTQYQNLLLFGNKTPFKTIPTVYS